MQFFKQLIALVVPFLSLCVYAQESTSELNLGSTQSSVVNFDYIGKGKFYSNANGSTSEGVVVNWAANYQRQLMDNLKLSFYGGFHFESDRTQEFFVDSSSGNRLDLDHALIEWSPSKIITLQAGALNQSDTVNRRLLLGAATFPATYQKFTFKFGDWNYGFALEQAIPTSRTYSTKAVESEASPSFFFEEVFANYKLNSTSQFSFNLGYFAFYQLPSQVAEESSLHGNIVARMGPNESYFIYPFQGWSLSASYQNQLMKNYKLALKFEYVNNIKAPSESSQANAVSVNLHHSHPNSLTTYELILFEQQQQAAPSYYLDDIFGYSNRMGWGLGAKHYFINSDFYIGFEWVESQLIKITPEQADQRTIQIYLGVDNA